MQKELSYLALGDSYTIGELVPPEENFPNQVHRILIEQGIHLAPPRIIAKTGWTTHELETGILESGKDEPFKGSYDFVSLLIGVNNQYRGRSVEEYKTEFEGLLKKAIRFAGNQHNNVVILSIPDWGVTPFAKDRDSNQIATEIDAYNAANKQIAKDHHIYYIDITPLTREAADDHTLLTADGLHPSGKDYQRWAKKVAAFFMSHIR
ncbi:MAG TPA: SGNH/GDSL hydrolase family protein [Chitinophagaceae bacterium]|mgnify:CR=1 FL=1|nr:SGNH/GDSL hydrolase family protein [Chitinophagales bacterium]HRX93498.1 SGNH/GDSL hydrolase family protein [Chitinophagaceae bacterium]